jgi:hypothetical protein
MEVANGRFRRPTALEKARQCTWLFEMQASVPSLKWDYKTWDK